MSVAITSPTSKQKQKTKRKVSMFNEIVGCVKRAVGTVVSFCREKLPAIFGAGIAAAGFLSSGAVAHAEDATAVSIGTDLSAVATQANSVFNAMVPLAIAAVALGILIKFLRKGSGR